MQRMTIYIVWQRNSLNWKGIFLSAERALFVKQQKKVNVQWKRVVSKGKANCDKGEKKAMSWYPNDLNCCCCLTVICIDENNNDNRSVHGIEVLMTKNIYIFIF